MRKIASYIIIVLIVIKISVWYFDSRLNDSLESVVESANQQESLVDSIRTLRIQIETEGDLKEQTTHTHSLGDRIDSLTQNFKNEERRLLNQSLEQYLNAQAKINNHLRFLRLINLIVDVLFVLIVGILVYKAIKGD